MNSSIPKGKWPQVIRMSDQQPFSKYRDSSLNSNQIYQKFLIAVMHMVEFTASLLLSHLDSDEAIAASCIEGKRSCFLVFWIWINTNDQQTELQWQLMHGLPDKQLLRHSRIHEYLPVAFSDLF